MEQTRLTFISSNFYSTHDYSINDTEHAPDLPVHWVKIHTVNVNNSTLSPRNKIPAAGKLPRSSFHQNRTIPLSIPAPGLDPGTCLGSSDEAAVVHATAQGQGLAGSLQGREEVAEEVLMEPVVL